MNVILASLSPRRQELLRFIFDDFSIVASNCEESVPKNIFVDIIPEYLAQHKALDVANTVKTDSLVIGADTCVIYDNKVLGKPKNENDAINTLKMLSGNVHKVITGCAIVYKGKMHSFSVETEVEFYSLSDEEINSYIDEYKPFDKAGSYGIQDKAGLFVKQIKGDYFNVVGLPIARPNKEIEEIINAG